MPDPDETEQPQQETPEAEPQVQEQPPQQVAAPAPKPGGKVIPVPTGDFKKIKDEARERGRREALSELDQHAVQAGFTSMADALGALAKIKQGVPQQHQATRSQPQEKPTMPKNPENKTLTPAQGKGAADSARHAEERAKMRKQWRREEKQRRHLERELKAAEASKELQRELFNMGVRDVDYVERLIARQLAGKSEEEIAKFLKEELTVYVTDTVRKERPYLFGEVVAPANTGTNGSKPDGSQPATPAAGQPGVQAAQEQQFDARNATPQQVQERLRKLGLNPYM